MPFVDLNKRLGVNLDHWILTQSGPQPHQRAARCHAFEKEWIECSHGIGQTRAKKECQVEFEDFYECIHRQKTVSLSGFLKKNVEYIYKICKIQNQCSKIKNIIKIFYFKLTKQGLNRVVCLRTNSFYECMHE